MQKELSIVSHQEELLAANPHPEFLVTSSTSHPARPLVLRGGLFSTFGSLAGFLALVLLSLGIYLLEDCFSDPLTAQPGALIGAGFILGLDAVLFYFLLKPRKKMHIPRFNRRRRRSHSSSSL
jgi:hypothetical protein